MFRDGLGGSTEDGGVEGRTNAREGEDDADVDPIEQNLLIRMLQLEVSRKILLSLQGPVLRVHRVLWPVEFDNIVIAVW